MHREPRAPAGNTLAPAASSRGCRRYNACMVLRLGVPLCQFDQTCDRGARLQNSCTLPILQPLLRQRLCLLCVLREWGFLGCSAECALQDSNPTSEQRWRHVPHP